MPSYKQQNRSVRIKTPLGDDVLLLRKFTGSEALGRPFQYHLELSSEDHEIDHEKIIGANVTLYFEQRGSEPRCINGYISRFSQTKFEGALAEYTATLVPWLWFLTRSSNCRIFQNKKVPDILKEVFQQFGFSDVVNRLHGSYRTWSYCVQYRETAFNFVSRLMEEEGIYYYFQHEEGKHSIVLCDSPASHQQNQGYEKLLYRPASEGVQEIVTRWTVTHEVQSDEFTTTNFDFTAPSALAVAKAFSDRSHGQSKLEQFEYLGEQSPFDEYSANAQNENERYSKMRLEELQAKYEIYSGESDARGISAGACFTLEGHPRADFNRNYLTTAAEHAIQANPFETVDDYGKGFEYAVKLAAVGLDVQFRTPRVTPKPIVHGPQSATVVGQSGQLVTTDSSGFGMVKAQFHWDRQGTNDQNSSCYIRVSQAWASANWGDMALPHIGDEVIVEFLEGDPDRPIVTGRVYNQANMPPLKLPDNIAKRVWQDDFGNHLLFDATPGKENIQIYCPNGQSGATYGGNTAFWTQGNNYAGTVGDQISVGTGSAIQAYLGAYVQTVLGSNVEANVGGMYNVQIGTQATANVGPQFVSNHGLKYESSDSDDNKVTKGIILLSSEKAVNLVGAANHDTASSIMHADHEGVELTAGKAVKVVNEPLTTAGAWFAGIAAALPLAAAGLMTAMAPFVDAYSTASDTSTSQTALQKQQDLEIAAGVAEALSFVFMILVQVEARKASAASTAQSLHDNDSWEARLDINPAPDAVGAAGNTALIHTKKGALKLVRDDAAGDINSITLSSSGIVLETTKDPVTLKTPGGTITIDSTGNIKISGTTVKIASPDTDIGGGAVTIAGTPSAAQVSTLEEDMAQIQAADVARKAEIEALNEEVFALRTAGITSLFD
ncbi:MAG: type VI secretion system Vgr family protein [Opitutaceae bacterium]